MSQRSDNIPNQKLTELFQNSIDFNNIVKEVYSDKDRFKHIYVKI
jgi:hypothetical protein